MNFVCLNFRRGGVDDWEDSLQFPNSEDEYILNQTKGEGPPQVSSNKLRELDEQAALDEQEKLHDMEVIQPVVLTPEEAAQENTVETTLVFDWRFRGGGFADVVPLLGSFEQPTLMKTVFLQLRLSLQSECYSHMQSCMVLQ